jgi:ribonuclease HII
MGSQPERTSPLLCPTWGKSYPPRRCSSWFERRAQRQGYARIAGVDEVGRGALFGPVFAAAVILDPRKRIRGLRDSKVLTPEKRERLAVEIRRRAVAWSVAGVEAEEIDRINIHQASRLAMRKAVLGLCPAAQFALVDALRLDLDLPQLPIIGGDALSISVAAASIVAKVERDALMREWDRVYPEYGLARNKGYSTPTHKEALQRLGPTPLHRRSYLPVVMAIAGPLLTPMP